MGGAGAASTLPAGALSAPHPVTPAMSTAADATAAATAAGLPFVRMPGSSQAEGTRKAPSEEGAFTGPACTVLRAPSRVYSPTPRFLPGRHTTNAPVCCTS